MFRSDSDTVGRSAPNEPGDADELDRGICGTPFWTDPERDLGARHEARPADLDIRWPNGNHGAPVEALAAVERFATDVRDLDAERLSGIGGVWLEAHPGDWISAFELELSGFPLLPTPRDIRDAIDEAEGRLERFAREWDLHEVRARLAMPTSSVELNKVYARAVRFRRPSRRWTAEHRDALDAVREAEQRHALVIERTATASTEAAANRGRLDERKAFLRQLVVAAANGTSYRAVREYCLVGERDECYTRGERFAAARAVGQAAVGIVLADLVTTKTVVRLAGPFLVGSRIASDTFVADYVARIPRSVSGCSRSAT